TRCAPRSPLARRRRASPDRFRPAPRFLNIEGRDPLPAFVAFCPMKNGTARHHRCTLVPRIPHLHDDVNAMKLHRSSILAATIALVVALSLTVTAQAQLGTGTQAPGMQTPGNSLPNSN